MTVSDETQVGSQPPLAEGPDGDKPRGGVSTHLLRLGVSLVVPVLAIVGLYFAGTVVLDEDANRGVVVVMALIVGVVGVFALYYGMDYAINRLPEHHRDKVRPFAFVGPAVVLLAIFLVYPAINTVVLSLQDQRSENFVGLDNYVAIFSNSDTLIALRNSIAWVIVVPLASVVIGLTFAVLSDRLGRKTEALSKTFIFMPMAISFVGASIVWRFIYNFRPEGFGEQIGLLNGIFTGLGAEPVAWLLQEPWNNFYLMVILIWLQTGFAMVVLSAAIKSVPEDIIEAARIDGATETQVFRRVTIPSIQSTIVVVTTTVIITVWKVFDIVFVMTGGRFNTSVVAERMVTEFFTFRNNGTGAALAVVLLVAIIPLMVVNVKRFREQEETR
ncbi:MAG TPA: sugar ABC transporter permease [Acidimicrobiia bacterium]|nr:sugar ABC transporter permease [Acidimicrobiia bacterium]